MSSASDIRGSLVHGPFLLNNTSSLLKLLSSLLIKSNSLGMSKVLNISEFLGFDVSSDDIAVSDSDLGQDFSESSILVL